MALNMLADAAAELAKEEQRKSIDLHNRLLMHSSDCFDANCPSANCRRMKNLIRHKCGGRECRIGRRMGALLHLHVRQCSKSRCSVLKCRQVFDCLNSFKKQITCLLLAVEGGLCAPRCGDGLKRRIPRRQGKLQAYRLPFGASCIAALFKTRFAAAFILNVVVFSFKINKSQKRVLKKGKMSRQLSEAALLEKGD